MCACSITSDCLQPHGLSPTRIFCAWNFPGKNTGVGFHFLLQRIFAAQGSNLIFCISCIGRNPSLSLMPPGKPWKIVTDVKQLSTKVLRQLNNIQKSSIQIQVTIQVINQYTLNYKRCKVVWLDFCLHKN